MTTYPSGLCRAICRGLVRQLELERQHIRHLLSVEATDKVGELPEEEETPLEWMQACDDVSGTELSPKMVRAARERRR